MTNEENKTAEEIWRQVKLEGFKTDRPTKDNVIEAMKLFALQESRKAFEAGTLYWNDVISGKNKSFPSKAFEDYINSLK